MANDSGFGKVRYFEDFLDDTLNTFATTENHDSGGTVTIKSEVAGGVLSIYSDGTNGDIQNAFGANNWTPSTMGTIVFESRVKLDTLSQGCFVGLSDDNASDEIPIDYDDGTLTTTATDAVGFVFDSGKSSSYWYMVGVKAGVDQGPTACAVPPVITVWQTLRVVVEKSGAATFYIDGKYQGTLATALTASTVLCWALAQKANGTAATLDSDYVFVEGARY